MEPKREEKIGERAGTGRREKRGEQQGGKWERGRRGQREGQRGRRMQNFRKRALGKREVRQSRAVIGGNYDNSIPRARISRTCIRRCTCTCTRAGRHADRRGDAASAEGEEESRRLANYRPLLIT